MDDLKLFVWEDSLRDYTAGVMFALAHDAEEARELIMEKIGYESDTALRDLGQRPKVITKPEGFYVYGGG